MGMEDYLGAEHELPRDLQRYADAGKPWMGPGCMVGKSSIGKALPGSEYLLVIDPWHTDGTIGSVRNDRKIHGMYIHIF